LAEPFKNVFSRAVVRQMARHLQRAAGQVGTGFDAASFVEMAGTGLDALELKQRSALIEAALVRFLPTSFVQADALLRASLHPDGDGTLSGMVMDEEGIRGWPVMPMSGAVVQRWAVQLSSVQRGSRKPAAGNIAEVMDLLKEMTRHFSSEFAIRTPLAAAPDEALAIITGWLSHPSEHVRRLVSEGTRPRLPWAPQLPAFIADPSPLLPLLEALKDDPSEYVRRSVANNLNDIARDHPDLVVALVARWAQDASRERLALLRHACRGLVKRGHAGALAVLGFGGSGDDAGAVEITLSRLEVATPLVQLGGALEFSATLKSAASGPVKVAFDYVIHHVTARGTLSPKVFKGKVLTLPPGGSITLVRRHALRPITTRTYYAGEHRLEMQVNGVRQGEGRFVLELG
jgi:3-methyladenine DNA glycosylase AlkC